MARVTQSRSSAQRAFVVASDVAAGLDVEVVGGGLGGVARLAWAGELAPGFAVAGVESGVGAVAREEVDAFVSGERFDRNDDPSVFGENVADKEVDFVGGVGDGDAVRAALRGEEVSALAEAAGRLDLHADETAAGVEDEVVAIAVAVGFGDSESEAGGLP